MLSSTAFYDKQFKPDSQLDSVHVKTQYIMQQNINELGINQPIRNKMSQLNFKYNI